MTSFLHSADWQIGKPYARVSDPDKRARLRRARLEAIERIGAHVDGDTAFLLVAGDLFDSPTPTPGDVSAVCAAIGRLPLPVLVIPGNHDHGAPGGVWQGAFLGAERQRRAANLQVLLERRPLVLEAAVLLPCPLLRRSESADPCGWLRQLNWSEVPADRPRIVLAHGAVQGFGATDLDPHGGGDEDEENPSGAGNRLRLEGEWLEQVDYVALGDWHGLKQVAPKAWYAGTPEPDRFPRSANYRSGQVLRVEVERGAQARVTPLVTGSLRWHPLRFQCQGDADLARLEARLDELLDERVGEDLLLLEIGGSLSLAGQSRWETIVDRLEAQLLRLKLRGRFRITPSGQELAALVGRPGDPLIARVAARLQERLDSGEGEDREVVELALAELQRSLTVAAD